MISSGIFSIDKKLDKTTSELVAFIYNIPLISVSVNALAAIITASLFIGDVEFHRLVLWCSLVISSSLIRTILMLWYRIKQPKQPLEAYWELLITTVMGLNAAAWGSSAFFLFVENSYELEMTLAAFVSVTAILVSMTMVYMPVIVIFQLLSLPPIIVMLVMQGTYKHYLTGGIMVLMMVATTAATGRHVKAIKEMIHLRIALAKEKYVAEQANLAKAKFLAAASHDLRQPLHALSIFSGVLVSRTPNSDIHDISKRISDSVSALAMLLDALLDISKLDAGAVVPKKVDFGIDEILSRLKKEYALQANAKGVSFKTKTLDSVVYSDPVLFETILRNILSNAVRYTSKGSIQISCIKIGESLSIAIADTGCGIKEEDKDIIFDEFIQLHNAERDRSNGLGLGLAIVKRLCNLLNHEFSLHSAIDKGTVFQLILPLSKHKQGSSCHLMDMPDILPEELNLCVVILEDEPEIRHATRILLEDWGVNVIATESAEDAVSLLDNTGCIPDAIIADLRLRGGKSGINEIDKFNTRFKKKLPSIIMTGDISSSTLDEANRREFTVLYKPVSPSRFRSFLQQVQRNRK